MGVTVAITRVACATSGGDQTITTTDLGGLTPKAALFIVSAAVTDGTAADHAVLGIGAATGASNQWAVGASDENAADPTDGYRRAMSDQCIFILNPADGTVDGEASFSAFVENGITINWGNAPASAYLLTVIFFAGTDLSVHANTFTIAAAGNTTDVTDPGFQPDLVLLASTFLAFNDTSASHDGYSFGYALDTNEQACISILSRDNRATSEVEGRLDTSNGIVQMTAGGGVYGSVQIGSFDASGFSGTTSGSISGAVGYLALYFNNAVSVEGGVISTPTSTGSQSVTDPNFQPQAVIVCMAQMAAVNTNYSDGSGGAFGISAFDADEAYCNSVCSEDNAAAGNTQSLSDDAIVNLPLHNGSAGHIASFTSFDATGWTWNFTTTQGTAVQWWYLAIEAAGGTQYPQSVAGMLTSAGALAVRGQKALGGTLSSAGQISRSVATSLAGTLSSAGVITKRTILSTLTGTLTSAGTLTAVKTALVALAGTLNMAGTVVKQVGKSLAGALTSSGELSTIRTFLVALAGILTSAGTLTLRTGKALAGALSSSGVITRAISKTLTGMLTSAGVVSKGLAQAVAGTLNLAGVLMTIYTAAGAIAANVGSINKGSFKAVRRIYDRGRRRL